MVLEADHALELKLTFAGWSFVRWDLVQAGLL